MVNGLVAWFLNNWLEQLVLAAVGVTAVFMLWPVLRPMIPDAVVDEVCLFVLAVIRTIRFGWL
jgi:hypothetical protein